MNDTKLILSLSLYSTTILSRLTIRKKKVFQTLLPNSFSLPITYLPQSGRQFPQWIFPPGAEAYKQQSDKVKSHLWWPLNCWPKLRFPGGTRVKKRKNTEEISLLYDFWLSYDKQDRPQYICRYPKAYKWHIRT